MAFRLTFQTAVWLVATAALLFLPAGTWHWPGAWVLLAEMGALGLGVGLWLARHDPGLLKERMSAPVQRGQQRWDRKLMAALLLLWTGWYVMMGLDVGRHDGSWFPAWAQVVGALGVLLCGWLVFLTFRENSFAAPVVKIQDERGQAVIASGPYGLVRHPIYAGAIPFFLGAPLLLGSLWGLVTAPLLIALLGLRAVLEERTLTVRLFGYADYASRVRYRLVPYLW